MNGYQDFNPASRIRANFERPVLSPLQRLWAQIKAIVVTTQFVKGMDISRYQNWTSPMSAKNDGFEFVVVKATEAVSWVDPKFTLHWQTALDNGYLVMVYHLFRSNYSGVDQADHCLETIQPLVDATSGRTCVWCDVETVDGATVLERRVRLVTFLGQIRTNFKKGGVYSSPYYWQLLTNNMALGDNWGWDASWMSGNTPRYPIGWTVDQTVLWQNGVYPLHTWVEPIPGFTTAVDSDRAFGTLDNLRTFLGYTNPPPPPEEDNIMEWYVKATTLPHLNVRNTPGGTDVGDIPPLQHFFIKNIVYAYNGAWAQISGGQWNDKWACLHNNDGRYCEPVGM